MSDVRGAHPMQSHAIRGGVVATEPSLVERDKYPLKCTW